MTNQTGDGKAPVEAQKPKPESETKAKPVAAKGKKPVKKKVKKKSVQKKKAKAKKPSKKKVAKKAAKKTKRKAKSKLPEKTTMNFKVMPSEAKVFKKKADKLTNGNITQMVRLAVMAWKPNRSKLPDIRPTTRA